MNRTYKHYWHDIRKTLIFYSLLPVLLFLLIAYPLLYTSFLYTIAENNEQYNAEISAVLEEEILEYMKLARNLTASGGVIPQPEKVTKQEKAEIYEKIYDSLKEHQLRAGCYVVDTQGNVLLSTNKNIPLYLQETRIQNDTYVRRLREHPDQVLVERYAEYQKHEASMRIGSAIEQDGIVRGYLIFDLSDEELLKPTQDNSSIVCAITNQFGYLFSGTVNNTLISQRKLLLPLRNASGRITLDGRDLYVVQQPLLDGEVVVYTITDMGYAAEMFVRIGILLLLFAAVLTGLLLLASQRFARRKSKVLDDMVTAIRNIQNGDLTARLDVKSKDEFQLFAEEYNRTLSKLQQVMKTNEEITRHTVISEIKQLESQFNPHFLYNTLNAIKYMVELEPEGAQEMITNLSDILRYSIKETDSQTLLATDLEYTKSYLTILQYRFRDMLEFSFHIAPEVMNCLVPKLIIQPVIENAVKYGFQSRTLLTIGIWAQLHDWELVLVIKNDGEGMEAEHLAQVRSQLECEHDSREKHIGLYNIHRRIQLLYGKNYGLEIESTPETGTTVTIRLPVERGKSND